MRNALNIFVQAKWWKTEEENTGQNGDKSSSTEVENI